MADMGSKPSYFDPDGNVRCGDCDKIALHETHGNEVQYMCTDHGWVATLHESPAEPPDSVTVTTIHDYKARNKDA
jgi:hypothetical protein